MKTNLQKTKAEIKALQDAMIYTKEAFARVFGVQVKRVRRTMLWAIGFWVWLEGKRPRLYKKALFTAQFAAFRKASAKNYSVKHIPNGGQSDLELYTVTHITPHPVTGYTGQYSVILKTVGDRPIYSCGCEDYIKMSIAFKAPACKHVYAVLALQGFGSMAEAIATNKAEYDARLALGI